MAYEKDSPEVRQKAARKLFLETNMTQQEIAKLTGTEPSQLSRWKQAGKWEEIKEAESTNPAAISREVQNALKFMLADIKESGIPITVEQTKQVVSLVDCIQKMKSEPTLGEASIVLDEMTQYIAENYPEFLDTFIEAQNKFLAEKALQKH